MTGDRIVREGIRGIAMIVMAINIIEQTAHMLAQRIIKDQDRVSFRTADGFRLLEQILDATVIDAVLEPRCFGEEAGEVGFVSTLQHTAGDVGQTFVVQDDQTCQVILEMVKLAPILKEIAKDVRVGGHDGSRSHDGKLHEPFALSRRGWERAQEYHMDASNGKTQQSRWENLAFHLTGIRFYLYSPYTPFRVNPKPVSRIMMARVGQGQVGHGTL